MKNENRIMVEEAAVIMGVSPQFIRIGLQRGIFPWGYALKMGPRRYTYFINRVMFMKEIEKGVRFNEDRTED